MTQTLTLDEIRSFPIDLWTQDKIEALLEAGVPGTALVELEVVRDAAGVALPDGFRWLAAWPGASALGAGASEPEAWENLMRCLA